MLSLPALSLTQILAARVDLGITIFRLDEDERLVLLYANAAADQGTGFPFRDHVGEALTDFFPGIAGTPYPQVYAEAARETKRVDLGAAEYGDEQVEQALFEITAVGLGDRHVGVVYRSVTAHQQAEQSRTGEREFLAAILENVQAGIVACDADGRLTLFNDAAKRFHGLAPDAGLDPVAWADTYALRRGDGSPLPVDEIPLRRAFRGEQVEGAEMQIAPEGLPTRHLLASGRQLRAEDGRTLGAVVVMHDVTDRIRAEEAKQEATVAARTAEAVKRSEARHRLLLRATASIVWTVSSSGLVEEPMPEWAAFTGQSWDDYNGDGWLEAVHPDDQERTRAAWARAVASGEPYAVEHRLRRHDGAYRWMAARAVPFLDEDGRVAEWVGAHAEVHERREAEAERARREADFIALADSIPQLVWITDPEGYHEYYNARWYAYTGLPHEETEGEGWNAVLHPDDQERAFEVWRRSLGTGEPYTIEYRFRRHDGAYRWFLGQALPRRAPDGTIERWFGTCTDIHDRKEAALREAEARSALRESEARRRLALDAAAFGTWHVDPATLRLDVDERYREIWGAPPQEPLGFDEAVAQIHEADRPRVLAAVERAMDPADPAPYAEEYRVVLPDGATRWVLAQGRSFTEPAGRGLVSFNGIIADVTERKEAEAALRQSEADFRVLIDNLPELAWTAQPDGEIDFYNRRWYAYTGTDLEEMQGWGWEKVHDPAVLPEVRRRWARSIETGELFEMEFPLRGADGVYRWFLTRVTPLLDADGAVTRWVGINTNIDDLRRTTAALEDARGQLADTNRLLEQRVAERTEQLQEAYGTLDGVLNGTTDLIAAVDARYRVIAFNDGFAATFEAVYGMEIEEGMSLEEALPGDPEEQERARANWSRALAGEAFTEVQEEDYPGIGHRAFDLRYSPMTAEDGSVEGAVCVVRDVTAQREAEASLARYAVELEERNAELQQFAYVASHDLQEPLRMVTSFLQLLERRYADQIDDAGREYIGYAVDGARRMQTLIQDLLAYSRIGTHGKAFGPVDLGDEIETVFRDLGPLLAETGADVQVLGELPTVEGDAGQLRQVFQNLLANAVKFRRPEAAPRVQVTAEPASIDGEPGWAVSVEDNGIGLDPKYADRVFQVFQRLHTRDEYAGTGIGLAIVKKVVERHGGAISFEPARSGPGTRFTVKLPKRAGAAPPAAL